MPAKVWIAGEGNNELGPADGYGGRASGALEALLVRARADGWVCDGKIEWRHIHKFRAGGARSNHGDYRNVLGLVLDAYEKAGDAVAFTRDVDNDPDREDAVDAALAWIRQESGWLIEVIGGVAKPAIEGWILALKGHRDTDEMSRQRALERLAADGIDPKSTAQYIEVIEAAQLGEPDTFDLPPGTASLQTWLSRAHEVLNRLVDGRPGP